MGRVCSKSGRHFVDLTMFNFLVCPSLNRHCLMVLSLIVQYDAESDTSDAMRRSLPASNAETPDVFVMATKPTSILVNLQ